VKRSLLIALLVVFGASVAFAQPGSIGLFADPTLSECNIGIPPAGMLHVYVGHVFTASTASQFAVDYSGLTSPGNIILSETPTAPIVAIGTSTILDDGIGISLAYGQCLVGSHMILDLQFWISFLVPPCTYLAILPDPAVTPTPAIRSADCTQPNPINEFPTGGEAIASWDPDLCNCSVPVEETTWGGIKALYQ
jgi:hypothetical protein